MRKILRNRVFRLYLVIGIWFLVIGIAFGYSDGNRKNSNSFGNPAFGQGLESQVLAGKESDQDKAREPEASEDIINKALADRDNQIASQQDSNDVTEIEGEIKKDDLILDNIDQQNEPKEDNQTDPKDENTAENIKNDEETFKKYPLHQNISVTLFWVGEDASEDNKNISNSPSAWDDDWQKHFGGVDDPKKRKGYFPAKFRPKENPFYFALPYNDFSESGKRKAEVASLIPWFSQKQWNKDDSVCKNRWIRVIKGDKIAYAQWEDVGPFGEDDEQYVFGSTNPKSKTNQNAGLDLSPAVNDYLGLKDVDRVNWQFVDDDQVPAGPWKEIITTRQVYWN